MGIEHKHFSEIYVYLVGSKLPDFGLSPSYLGVVYLS